MNVAEITAELLKCPSELEVVDSDLETIGDISTIPDGDSGERVVVLWKSLLPEGKRTGKRSLA